jgi:hypothetical protein
VTEFLNGGTPKLYANRGDGNLSFSQTASRKMARLSVARGTVDESRDSRGEMGSSSVAVIILCVPSSLPSPTHPLDLGIQGLSFLSERCRACKISNK